MPPTALATTGTPAANASSTAIGSPSRSLGSTSTSAAGSSRPTSWRSPRNRTRSPSAAARRSSAVPVRAVAGQQQGRAGHVGPGVEQQVDPLRRRQPRHAQHDRRRRVEPELAPHLGAYGGVVDRRRYGVLHDAQPRRVEAARRQPLGDVVRDRDDEVADREHRAARA